MRYFLVALLACTSLLAAPVCTPEKPQPPNADSQAQAGPAVPDSAAGLESQLEEIVKIKDKKDLKRREQLSSALRIPDPGAWFARAFGNDDGGKLAGTYKSTWEQFEDSFTNSVTNLAEQGRTDISIKEISLPAKPAVEGQGDTAAADAKKPAVFYTAHAAKASEPRSPLPGIFIYEQGAFRLVNGQTLYTLPYMQPTRIRIGGNVAAGKLLQQVSPVYPPEAIQNKVSGIVMLPVILDREGRVMQVNLGSGPPELVEAAINAVRQWRYQPTLLNGDPVEVDTLVSVAFRLH